MSGASISYPHSKTGPAAMGLPSAESSQSRTDRRSVSIAMATCYPAYEMSPAQRTVQVPVQKDYSRPLHVDCSVEYELPNAAKPPQGVRNEPLLMIHPCYFRKIESQRRSPFVNNLPSTAPVAKRRPRQPQPAAPYPVQYSQQQWEPMPPPAYCKREEHWQEPARSPDRPEDNKHILSGKYRQYLRAHRLHPYVTSAIPLASTFPQIQQVCYNV